MNVADLIKELKKLDQKLPVAYEKFSEHCMLEASDLALKDLCEERQDGWVANARPDKPKVKYLVFPGN